LKRVYRGDAEEEKGKKKQEGAGEADSAEKFSF